MTVDDKKKVETVPADSGATGTTQKTTNGYQSQWKSQIDDIFGKIQNREPFKYDVNADALYEQYKDQYINQGKLAMEDTIGQAATLTGGYDNSYAQSVGQQTYNRYLEGLTDIVPELYQMALDRYMKEEDDLMSEYALLLDRDNLDYGRYQDAAGLAQSQVETMLGMGVRPSDDLISQSGFSKEYIDAILSKFAPSGGGGSSGGSRGSGGRGGGSGSSSGSEWASGINTDRNQNGLKGSAWDYTLNNLDRLLASGDTQKASDYMDQVAGQMNESQFNQAMDKWNKYKK